jgi:hypothetical protein
MAAIKELQAPFIAVIQLPFEGPHNPTYFLIVALPTCPLSMFTITGGSLTRRAKLAISGNMYCMQQ